MPISLKEWARNEGYTYPTAYRKYRNNEIKGAYKDGGDIFIGDYAPVAKNKYHYEVRAATTQVSTRRNRAAVTTDPERFGNIDSLFTPFFSGTSVSISNDSGVTVREAINLSRKAYYGVAIIRKVINILVSFCVDNIFLTGGNAKSRTFFNNYFKFIRLKSFQKQFFLEFWRGGNVFIYKIKGRLKSEHVRQLRKEYESVAEKITIPLNYTILNPTDILYDGSVFFGAGAYYKQLNEYEINRLRNPQTEIDKRIYESMPPDVKKTLSDQKKKLRTIRLDLPNEYLITVFNGKQDYESFAVPFAYPVLEDVDFKMQMKKIDRAIINTCQNIVLHAALGYEDKQGNYQFSDAVAQQVQSILGNETVNKTLITDFTADLKFIIPDVDKILDPKKYQVVNEDIRDGLMDVISGGGAGEKFSNLSTKVKVFVEQVRKAREAFIEEFLKPEMELIGREMGFKSIPEPHFEEIDIEDNINFYRVITQLSTMGILTPEEVFEAFQSGRIPTPEESVESQERFKELKDKGLYQPQNAKQDGDLGGRPAGTQAPQTTKTPGQIGTSNAFVGVVRNYSKLLESIGQELKKQHKVKKFNKEQKEFVELVAKDIICHENAENWLESVGSYLDSKATRNKEIKKDIEKFAQDLNMDVQAAALYYHSTIA